MKYTVFTTSYDQIAVSDGKEAFLFCPFHGGFKKIEQDAFQYAKETLRVFDEIEAGETIEAVNAYMEKQYRSLDGFKRYFDIMASKVKGHFCEKAIPVFEAIPKKNLMVQRLEVNGVKIKAVSYTPNAKGHYFVKWCFF